MSKFFFVVLLAGAVKACSPPTLATGETWTDSPNCVGVLITSTAKCHCWGHCGYICNSTGTTTASPVTPRTPVFSPICKPEFANGPNPLPSDEQWISMVNCTFGLRPGFVLTGTSIGRCTCYQNCGYRCDSEL